MIARRLSSIRARITLLVLVPLLALAGLWIFATSVTYGDAAQLLSSKEYQDKSVLPTQRLIDALQKERRLSLAQIGAPRTADRGALRAQRESTDDAADAVRRHSGDGGLRDAVTPEVVEKIDAQVARLGTLEAVRRGVDDHADRPRVLEQYSALIDSCFAVYYATVPGNGTVAIDARTLTSVGRAREYLAREDALLTGALAAGRLSAAERGQFAQLAGAQRTLYADTIPTLPGAERARYEQLTSSPEFVQLRSLEDQVIRGAEHPARTPRDGQATGTGGHTARTPAQPEGQGERGAAPRTVRANGTVPEAPVWRTIADTASNRLYQFENRVLDRVTDDAEGIAVGVFVRLGIAGGLGLIAVVLSAYIAFRVSRRLLRECRTLAAGVVDFTRQRLPLLAEQVRAGQPAGADLSDLPRYDYRLEEIRQIAESFDRAREAVLVAAAGEVAARRGISEVFVNLARRNQALLHRQLSLLDTMERRTEDPAELSDLFRLDHLATRMRRHAEGLVILAGKTAGRGWRRPVPLVDVVRGAVAEVEDYPRVRVQPLPRIALLGSAVADVIHLLAEIVENATTFSPPQSPVRVSGHPVPNGFAIEVEDRGLGMTDEALRSANARLSDPPEFDPSDSAQLGLFVVARLARRHDVKVTLRHSAYGGTTAIALIPSTLIVEAPDPDTGGRRSTGPMRTLPKPATALEPARASAGTPPQTAGIVRLVAEAERSPEPVPEPRRAPEPERPRPAPQHARPEPEHTEHTERAEPKRAAPERVEPQRAEPEAQAPLAEGGLPKRRRQTHLAPQLRERVDAHLAAEGRAPQVPADAPLAAPVPDAPRPEAPGPRPRAPRLGPRTAARRVRLRRRRPGRGRRAATCRTPRSPTGRPWRRSARPRRCVR
ncbi:nitrate- and nitrite sensing domain-containing protein [Actinomadura sp. J1-007]|uniref:nitrate- and nitrite sensing domain-containing protein n=1 Tax=Actinomadura sp. J1-007 TaxID=2661913 RepID=UPI0019D5F4AC|nr:nitrate- and nitrite sensing domain-containing protein [Actinomadura sp. J1-007]